MFAWAKAIIIAYCGIGIVLFYLQDIFIFLPKKLSTDHVFRFDFAFEEVTIPVNREDTISLLKFLPEGKERKGVVIYYHGNKNNVEHYAVHSRIFTSYGYEVWMQDYPGYGKSRGERTEQKLYDQAMIVRNMAAGKFGADSIIVYGRSLGSGIAGYVASMSQCRHLVLETPYYSIPALLNSFTYIYPASYMSKYKIPTGKYIQDVAEPITIFHGRNDWIIPYRCAARLKQCLKAGDEFVTIDGGSHNNLSSTVVYRQKMDAILK